MKQGTIIFALLLITLSSFSQRNYISGTVKDKTSSEPLAYCSVRVIQADTLYNFAITDSKGYFEIPAKSGKYNIIINFVGYNTDTIKVAVMGKSKFLGNIFLRADATIIGDVEIKESANSIHIDKNETIITENLRAGTSTASDVLDKVNGVSLDRYNDDIKVDNDKNILLLVNGLKKDQQYIKNINPNRIAKVEVIRDPSGRYGLEGYSSVINIILKKNYVGQELFVNSMNIFDFDSPDINYLMPMNNAYFNYNYTRKTLNMYAQYWGGIMRFSMLQSITKIYGDSLNVEQKSKDGSRNSQNNNFSSYLTLGSDYQLSSVHTISFEGHLSGQPTSKAKEEYLIQNIMNDSVVSQQSFKSSILNTSTNYSGTAYYIGNFSDTKSLKADLTLGGRNSSNQTDYKYDSFDAIINQTKGVEFYSKVSVEWTHSLGKKFTYQTGYGNTWDKMENNLTSANTGTSSADFIKTDLRNNAFVYGTWKIAKPLSLKTGIAVENSLPEVNNQKQNYWIYKPHFDLQYKPIKWLTLKLKYRSKADYPSLNEANPIETYIDNYTVQRGNPYLKPSTIHKTSFKASAMNGFVSATVYYDFSSDYIAPVGNLRDDGIFEYSYDNLGNYIDKGVKFNFAVPISKKIFWQNNAKIYNSQMTYQGNENNITDWSGESQLMYINKKSGMWAGLMLQKSNRKYITAQGYGQSNNDFWGLMAQKPFLNKKLSVMLMYMLPIDWLTDYTQDTYIKTQTYTKHSIMDLSMIKNIFLFKISYRFHSGREIQKVKKDIKREEEKKSGGLF